MTFAAKIWRLLVGIKDGLALLFLLLFFALLYAALSLRPSPAQVHEGALLLELDGSVMEEATAINPLEILMSGIVPPGEYPVHDLVRAIDTAATDDRITAISLDLSRFTGGGQVNLGEVGAALDRFRANNTPNARKPNARKKVLAFANAYIDESLQLAVHADEVWVDPMGGAVIRGPGGENLYYTGLLEKLKIKAHIFRVGTYKAAVEPYFRTDMSPEAREDRQPLAAALWKEWKADVTTARPSARIAQMTQDPVAWLTAQKGDLAKASKASGLVDRIGDRVAYGQRLAELVGEDLFDDTPGGYAHTDLETWLGANGRDTTGKPIGIITIAGEIVDGDAGPGTAGGDRIAEVLDDALDEDLAALVVRVDSPGGSVTASEEIRRAILRHKARGIPIAVSMANVAASGGYWVATPADRIFAAPATITGSIGVFGIIPTFEDMLGQWGVTSDGVRTTRLSGQPDLLTGLTPEVVGLVQQLVEDNYARFLGLVAKARGKTPEQIDAIAQGRVWDGGTARQIGLVDQYGGLKDALAWAAKAAKLEDGHWHARFLGQEDDPFHAALNRMVRGEEAGARAAALDPVAALTSHRQGLANRLSGDLVRLLGSSRAQAFCLECPVLPGARASAPPVRAGADKTWLAVLARLVA